MPHILFYTYLVILLAYVFDFINGFHDAANSIATIVSTGVLKPLTAVLWAAFFNFIAFLFFHLNVAGMLGTGLVGSDSINTYVIFSALVGAIIFNLITWYFGLPSSSSHALIGGLIGAAVAQNGWGSLKIIGITKVLVAIAISPLLGLMLAFILLSLVKKIIVFWNFKSAAKWARRFQLLSAALLSLGHGANDAQKTMGIIAGLLFSLGWLGPKFFVPFWVIVSCNLVMGLGTLAGGWRIVHTLGEKITKLEPLNGSAAETASAITIFAATALGIPISTTHTVTGAIVGVGMQKAFGTTNWNLIKKITSAWFFTIPVAALMAAGIFSLKILI